jgi:arylformamidase
MCPLNDTFGFSRPMKIQLEYNSGKVTADLSLPIDISLCLSAGEQNVNAYYIPPPVFEPFRVGGFVGSVALGGACNCENIVFNAHGNGTHTECVGHISKERITINSCLKKFFFISQLLSVRTEKIDNGDHIITRESVERQLDKSGVEALLIRTLPNDASKKSRQYSGSNPPYLEPELCKMLVEKGIRHLLIDLPSVDREEDGGELLAHHAFWNYPAAPRMDCTITELTFVPDEVKDGTYLLNIQIASFESDASPSKPVLYAISG